jgi:peroxiredoxin
LFRRILKEYADVPVEITGARFSGWKTVGDKARKGLYVLEHLQAGAFAPDFDSQDLDGNPLRLADYRGKVLLVSFWFTGCGACMEEIPKEKELKDKYRGKPFALIGVCRDKDAATGKKTAAEHGMTWPSVHDGPSNKIIDAYNVLGFPRFYLIDAEGKIASKNPSLEAMEDDIEKLVAKAAKVEAVRTTR